MITIWFTGTQTNPTGFTVKHHTASGEIHSREDQYRDIQRQSTLGYDRWSGVSIKDPKLTMIGTLSDDQVKGKPVARYVEKLFRNGKLQNTVTSVCRPIDEDIK